MLFITNRVVKSPNNRRRLPRSIRFDLNDVSPRHLLSFCERSGRDDYQEIGSPNFLDKLRESNAEQILLYIHGFNNQPERDIFPRTEVLQELLDGQADGLVEVVPVIWPSSDGVTEYFNDQMAADMSGFAFARALEKLRQRQITATDPQNDVPECLKRINVLAHSMGNRVLREALRIWCSSFIGNHPPLLFRNTFMASADVVNETLHTPEGRNITNASANIVVYFASDDLALRASKIANAGQASRRLGHTGPEDLTRIPHRVVSIDCDAVNSKYDNPKGHSYFLRDQHGRPAAVFRHIFSTIQSGRVGDPANPLQRVP